jgi:hypothetical protein
MVTALDPQSELTPAQAARLIGLTPARIRQLMRLGQLQYRSTPLGRLIDPTSLQRLLTTRETRRTQCASDQEQ